MKVRVFDPEDEGIETSGTTHPTTQRHIQEVLSLQGGLVIIKRQQLIQGLRQLDEQAANVY